MSIAALMLTFALVSCATSNSSSAENKPAAVVEQPPRGGVAKAEDQKPLAPIPFFMRHNLDESGKGIGAQFKDEQKWVISEFTNKGRVWMEGDAVFIERGNDMTGITWKGPICRTNYEITLEAKRAEGGDFFCGLTFPYGNDPCSLILGGWGGSVCGISSLDYYDAYNNETCTFEDFKQDQWYKVKLRVSPTKIEAWIDDRQIIDVKTEKKKIGIRWEVEPSVPLGIATWQTTGAIRNIEFKAF